MLERQKSNFKSVWNTRPKDQNQLIEGYHAQVGRGK